MLAGLRNVDVTENRVVQAEHFHELRDALSWVSLPVRTSSCTAKVLVHVAAVQVDDDARGLDDLVGHEGEGALALRARGVSG